MIFTWRYVSAFAALISAVNAKETRVMPLLHHDISDARLIVLFQLHARLSNRIQLDELQLVKVAFRDAVAKEDDTRWLEASRLVKLYE